MVTCSHVVRQQGATLRVNTTSGGTETLTIPAGDWTHHPDNDDVAAAPIALSAHSDWSVRALEWMAVVGPQDLHRQRMRELNIGVGDEVAMLGRFAFHGGQQRNQPLARFGNIAMMPGERVWDGRGLAVDAYLVEMRSLAGFSGSPVFVLIGAGSYRGDGHGMMPFHQESIGLLGIDTGHKQDARPVLDKASGRPVTPSSEVRLNTGVAIVAPVSKLAELLEHASESPGRAAGAAP